VKRSISRIIYIIIIMRKCCGYYCAMIAVVGIFFYSVIIVMELRKNQFVLYKMQYPEEAPHDWALKNSTHIAQI